MGWGGDGPLALENRFSRSTIGGGTRERTFEIGGGESERWGGR